MDKLRNIKIFLADKWEKYPAIGTLCVFFLVFVSYAAIYLWNPGVLYIDDHFFHFKYAYLLRTHGWDAVKNFDWIYLTRTVKDHTDYPVSLFQISLIPFTYIKDMVLGLKISDVFWGSLSIAIVYLVFRKSKIRYPELFLLILVSAGFFASRMLAGRAFVLSSALSLLLLYLASEKKYKKFFIVSILYILWHQSTFFIPVVIACMVEASRVLSQQKIFAKNLVFAALGSLIGLLIFSGSIIGGIKNIITTQLSVTGGVKGEGMELYKNDIFQVFGRSEIFFLLLIVSFFIVVYLYVKSKKDSQEAEGDKSRIVYIYSAFLFSLMSLAGILMVSGRFFDLYFSSIVFLIGVIITKLLADKSISISTGIEKSILAGAVLFFAFAAMNNFLNMKQSIFNNDYTPVARVAEWVKDKSKDKELVYLYNWGDFPVSFFFNDKNVYDMGIEPQALFGYDENLYWKWYNISNYGVYCGEPRDCEDVKEQYIKDFNEADQEGKDRMNKENSQRIIESIRKDFKSRFVIVSGSAADTFKLNQDMLADSFEAKSETGSGVAYAFELK